MKPFGRLLGFSLVLALAGASASWGQNRFATGIVVEQSWAPTTIGQSRTGAAYMTIVNHGEAADRLVGASSPAAGKVELHATQIEGGIARMRPVPVMDVKPHDPVALKPGGLHLMLMDLREPLAVGRQFPLTLKFEKAGEVVVSVNVGAPAAEASGGHDHH